jgi:uncharacterized protein YceH (UPF0502 family)
LNLADTQAEKVRMDQSAMLVQQAQVPQVPHLVALGHADGVAPALGPTGEPDSDANANPSADAGARVAQLERQVAELRAENERQVSGDPA